MVLTTNEALKAAIDGKRIRPSHPGFVDSTRIDYLYFNGSQFRIVYQNGKNALASVIGEDEWEILPDTVAFTEAYKQYKNGKAVASCTGDRYKKDSNGYDNLCVTEEEIDGEWRVWEE